MQKMDTMKVLEMYRKLTRELEELERQLELATPSGKPAQLQPHRSGEPGTNNRLAATMQLADGLEERAQRHRDMLAEFEPHVAQILQDISDGRELQVVQQFYVQALTDRAISACMGLSEARVAQIRRGFAQRSCANSEFGIRNSEL